MPSEDIIYNEAEGRLYLANYDINHLLAGDDEKYVYYNLRFADCNGNLENTANEICQHPDGKKYVQLIQKREFCSETRSYILASLRCFLVDRKLFEFLSKHITFDELLSEFREFTTRANMTEEQRCFWIDALLHLPTVLRYTSEDAQETMKKSKLDINNEKAQLRKKLLSLAMLVFKAGDENFVTAHCLNQWLYHTLIRDASWALFLCSSRPFSGKIFEALFLRSLFRRTFDYGCSDFYMGLFRLFRNNPEQNRRHDVQPWADLFNGPRICFFCLEFGEFAIVDNKLEEFFKSMRFTQAQENFITSRLRFSNDAEPTDSACSWTIDE